MRFRFFRWIAWVAIFAFWSTLILIGMSRTFWQTGTNFGSGLLLAGIFLAFLLLVALGIVLGKRKLALTVGVAFSPILAGIVIWMGQMRQQEDRSKEVGQTIIAAIEKFRTERGEFPKTLDELVPGFLPVIPKTEMKLRLRDFRYGYSKEHNLYWLSFKFADWKMSTWDYHSKSRQWTRMPSS